MASISSFSSLIYSEIDHKAQYALWRVYSDDS